MSVFTHPHSWDYSVWSTQSCILGLREGQINTHKKLQHLTSGCFTSQSGFTYVPKGKKIQYFFLHSEALLRHPLDQLPHSQSYKDTFPFTERKHTHRDNQVPSNDQKTVVDQDWPLDTNHSALGPCWQPTLLSYCIRASHHWLTLVAPTRSPAFLLNGSQMPHVGCRRN